MPSDSIFLERIEAPVTAKAYLMCAFAAFAGILFGYDSGYIASVMAMPQFTRQYGHLNSTESLSQNFTDIANGTNTVYGQDNSVGFVYYTWEKSLTVSILSAGTFCGALASGALADRFGRRTIIIAGSVVFCVGVAVQTAWISVAALAVGRLIAGVGVGFVSAVNILYMSEVAPRKVRGAIVSCYQFAITIGIMLASCVCYATQDNTDSSAFRIPIGLQFFWALILGGGLTLLPESPRYYVRKGRLDQAVKALARLRGQPFDSEHVQDELAEIQANYEYELQIGELSWHECLTGGEKNRNSNLRKVFVGCALQAMQQFTGINFVFYYNTTFFQQIGLKNPFLISMVTTIVNVVSTPLSFYTVEKFGRRPLLVWGAIGMAICEFIVAIVGTADSGSLATGYCLIVFVCLYVFFFASTWGPCAWVVIGEIFQLQIRAKGVSMSTASNWFCNCVIGVVIPYMIDPDKGGLGVRIFFVWGATCMMCALFAYIFVPETKGLSLEQVDRMMSQVSARKSSNWRAHDAWVHELRIQHPNEFKRSPQTQIYHFDDMKKLESRAGPSYPPSSRSKSLDPDKTHPNYPYPYQHQREMETQRRRQLQQQSQQNLQQQQQESEPPPPPPKYNHSDRQLSPLTANHQYSPFPPISSHDQRRPSQQQISPLTPHPHPNKQFYPTSGGSSAAVGPATSTDIHELHHDSSAVGSKSELVGSTVEFQEMP